MSRLLFRCGTALLYLVIQVPAFTSPETDRVFALIGMILCILALVGYCIFQVSPMILCILALVTYCIFQVSHSHLASATARTTERSPSCDLVKSMC